jgi:hypothetical protein
MFDGFVSLGDVELVNRGRTAAYVRSFLSHAVDLSCRDVDDLHRALQDAPYVSPAADGAPWYRASNPVTGKFYGFYPTGGVRGVEDSTRTVTITELAGDGAIQSMPRHGSKEIRFRGLMFAEDEEGMEAGMTWLRAVLDDNPCGGGGARCEGRDLFFYAVNPSAPTVGAALALADKHLRVMYRVEPLDGPRVVEKLNIRGGTVWEVEFLLNAGLPWAFTLPIPMTTTTNVVPAVWNEVYCPTQTDAYDQLVVDPQDAGVARPPRPPLIEPFEMPAQWNRYSMVIAAQYGERAGRIVPVVRLATGGSAARKVRVRFYRNNYNGACDYEGEFFITYVPPNAVLTIDGPRKKMTVLVGGSEKPAGNLVVGSDGRPALWPTMSCNSSYFVVVDAVGALNATVTTDLSIRE